MLCYRVPGLLTCSRTCCTPWNYDEVPSCKIPIVRGGSGNATVATKAPLHTMKISDNTWCAQVVFVDPY